VTIPERLSSDAPDIAAVHDLLCEAFAYMEGRIDPPSSLASLTRDDLRKMAAEGPAWVIRDPMPVACVFCRIEADSLYLGKLAVSRARRGQGLSRLILEAAEAEALRLGLPALLLQSRVELVENHAVFRAMGFHQIAETRHPGYGRTTSLTFGKNLG
jgi:GNAT superfamily N-acetyltransferase